MAGYHPCQRNERACELLRRQPGHPRMLELHRAGRAALHGSFCYRHGIAYALSGMHFSAQALTCYALSYLPLCDRFMCADFAPFTGSCGWAIGREVPLGVACRQRVNCCLALMRLKYVLSSTMDSGTTLQP